MIPVGSYIALRGKCRYCCAPISPRYPLVEAVCAGLALLCFARYGVDWRCPLSFGVSAILLAVSLIDHDTMEIPNTLVLALVPFAVCAVWGWNDIFWWERVIGFFTISLPMLMITLLIRDAFGGGDIKLIAVCGFLLGWENTLLAFFVALLLGGGYAAYLLASGKSKRGAHMAFGPYLCIGVAAAMFAGTEVVHWYTNLLL